MAQWTVYEVRAIDREGECFDVYSHDTLREAREDFGSVLRDPECAAVALEKVTRFDVAGKEWRYTLLDAAGDPAALHAWRTGEVPE